PTAGRGAAALPPGAFARAVGQICWMAVEPPNSDRAVAPMPLITPPVESPRPGSLPHPRDGLAKTGSPRPECGPPVCANRSGGAARRTHVVPHLRAARTLGRDNRVELEVLPC